MLLKNKSWEFGQHWFQRWIHINQDELGAVLECEITADNHLIHGGCVIVNLCNIDTRERSTWIELEHKHDALVVSVYFNTPVEVCLPRVMNRSDHPTLNNLLLTEFEALRVIRRFQRRLVLPSRYYEGIQICHTVRYGYERREFGSLWNPEGESMQKLRMNKSRMSILAETTFHKSKDLVLDEREHHRRKSWFRWRLCRANYKPECD